MNKKEQSISSVFQFNKLFSSDNACLDHLMRVRYGVKRICEGCGRSTKFNRISTRRVYGCQWCGHQISPCVGTPMERSHLPLNKWFFAIYLFTTSRHGVAAKELERQLDVSYKTAWRMAHEIRRYMAEVDGETPLKGVVEVDETYIGGKSYGGKRGRGAPGKSVVFGMLQRDGDIMMKVVQNVKKRTIQPFITENVKTGSTVHTDELRSYKGLNKAGYKHETVNHGDGEYVDGNSHVNAIEGFWARLKLSIRGTHVHVSGKHLKKYVKEFEYRYNRRKNPERMLTDFLAFQS